ncbi:MAG: hypothetical protein IJF97_00800 [Eggerthellaceae bacterium]|nr:hypothetical protein [Eggerthellaceae bacterium]MBQ3342669.1 hypothetical protein [Kiritimatiellia bacterium]MBQ9621576.1 hypothetical protein [Atopobiaceae bacterium]
MGSRGATVEVEQLGNEIAAIISDYEHKLVQASRKDVMAAARVSLEQLKTSSPRRTGMYAGNWAIKGHVDVLGQTAVVYEKAPSYRLTHLLEHGHGGPAPAPAYPHIGAAAEAGAAELQRRIRG